MLTVKAAQRFFFDRAAVRAAVDKGTQKVLSRFGAFVRTRAQRSIRTRKKASAPGSPPSSHEGSLKRLMFFVFEPATKGVVIGPALLGKGTRGGRTVPELLEHGGTEAVPPQVLFIRRQPGGAYAVARDGRGFRVDRPGRAASYPARPYMRPAFDAELKGKLAALLTDFITGGPS